MADGIVLPLSIVPGPDMESDAEAAGERAGTAGYTGLVKAWRKEEKTQGRLGSFVAAQFADLNILEGEAGRTAGRLIAIFSGGFGIMAGVEVLKFGLTYAFQYLDQLKAEAEAAQKILSDAPKLYADVSKGELVSLAAVAHDTADSTGKKFSDVYKDLTEKAQAHFAEQKKILADYQASLLKATPAQVALASIERSSAEERRKQLADLAKAEEDYAKAKALVAKQQGLIATSQAQDPTFGGSIALAMRDELGLLSKEADKAGAAVQHLRDVMSATARGEAPNFAEALRLADLEQFTRQAEQAKTANSALHDLDVKAALVTANDRQKIQIEAESAVYKIRGEWAGKDEEYAAQIIAATRRSAQAQLDALDREHARAHSAEMRRLAGELALVDADDRTRLAIESNEKLAAIWDEMAKAREKHDTQAAVQLGQKLIAQQRINDAQMAALEIREADEERARKAKEDKKAEAQRASDAEMSAKARAMRDARWDPATASRLQAAERARDEELAILFAGIRSGTIAVEEYEAAKTAILQRYASERAGVLRKENAVEQGLHEIGRNTIDQLGRSVGASFNSMATHSRAYTRAMEHAAEGAKNYSTSIMTAAAVQAQAILGSIADQAEVKAIYELAEGFRTLFTNPSESASHFTSAALFGTIGGAVAALGYGIGEVRGMTGSEKQSVDQATSYGATATSATTAREAGTASAGASVVRETVFVVADAFETPQETARRVARRLKLAKQLDMLGRDDT